MIRARALASIGMVLAGAVLFPAATISAENSGPAAAAAAAHRATLEQYCIGCHSGPTPFAGLNLEPLDFGNLDANGVTWEKLIRKLRGRQMPRDSPASVGWLAHSFEWLPGVALGRLARSPG